MSMKKLLAASAGLFALVAGDSALAADLRAAPAYKAPPPVAPDIWNGVLRRSQCRRQRQPQSHD